MEVKESQRKLDFKIGEKLVIDGANFIVTNLGTYPKGQPIRIEMPGNEQAFNVDINGCKAIFRESQIKMLMDACRAYRVEQQEDNLQPLNKKAR